MTPLVYIIGFVAIQLHSPELRRACASKFPIAGSVYSYVQRAINPHVGFMSGWLILLDYILVPSLLLVMVANWGTTLRARLALVALGGRVHRFQHVCERARHHHVEGR